MSDTLYESYEGSSDAIGDNCGGAAWDCQTFTVGNTGPNQEFKITSVKLYLCRGGTSTGTTVYVSIRETLDGSPTGTDKSTGSFNSSDLPLYPTYALKEVSMSAYNLQPSTKYALIYNCKDGSVPANFVQDRVDNTSPAYTGGSYGRSANSGSTWTMDTNQDSFKFYVYGLSIGINTKINIGDAWKDVASIKINIGDAWKDVVKVQINIGDAWKTVFG